MPDLQTAIIEAAREGNNERFTEKGRLKMSVRWNLPLEEKKAKVKEVQGYLEKGMTLGKALEKAGGISGQTFRNWEFQTTGKKIDAARRRFTDEQKVDLIQKRAAMIAAGEPREAAARKLGITPAVMVRWEREFGGALEVQQRPLRMAATLPARRQPSKPWVTVEEALEIAHRIFKPSPLVRATAENEMLKMALKHMA